MKKCFSNAKSKKKRILNRLGMTYVELLCALSLLSLIVVMFTPMLLSSYETLYKAGETVEKVYDSKEEIEEGLATRFSEKTVVFNTFNLGLNNLQTNADLLFQAMNVNGKKVVSSLQQGLETVFGNARASVDIISPKIVYDDKSNHDVMIQTSGIEYSKVIFGSYTAKYGSNQEEADKKFLNEYKTNVANGGKGVIFIEVMVPNKANNVSSSGTTTEEAVYLSTNVANLRLYKVENMDEFAGAATNSGSFDMRNTDNHGRIKFNISGMSGVPLDFTQSPVKINIYYVTPREQVRECSDYLIIDPPTMMFAGEANSNVDYYTSAGVTEKNGTYSLEVEARKMNVSHSGLFSTSDTPGAKGVTINTITWVQSDENAKLKPYYVMAGTNSSVYRMYNYRVKTTMNDVFGISGAANTTEGSLVLQDGSAANPSFWSGEMSDQYYFRTQEEANGYGGAADNTTDCTTGTNYNKFDSTLKYAMMFSGYNAGYNYHHQANRRISYILTEAGNKSFRLGGKKMELKDYAGYTAFWEPEYCTYVGHGKFLGFYTQFNTDDERVVYLYNDSGISDVAAGNAHYDANLAYIRLKSYISVNPFQFSTTSAEFKNAINLGDFWYPENPDDPDKWAKESSLSGCSPNTDYSWLSKYGSTVNVTSSVYLPGAGSAGQGQVIYFGNTPAYAFLRQSSDIGTTDNATKIYNNDKIKDSRATAYVVYGSEEGTVIYRSYRVDDNQSKYANDALKAAIYNNNYATADSASMLYNGNSNTVYKYVDNKTEFTLGYCSRWRMAIGDVTHNGKTEETRSYEKYYKASNPNAGYTRKPSTINAGGVNNLYYDVWFPGEYYNLTQVATLDEVTVAVGYALSGSVFMRDSAVNKIDGYYGTALGSIYNDGVMAAYVSEEAGGKVFKDGVDGVELTGKGEQNAIFQNILYYKSSQFTDSTLHSRESIRFTAVDLVSFTDTAGNKIYMAVYGDNRGKLFFSTIATSKVTNTSGTEGGAVESNVVLQQQTYSTVTELTYNDADPYAIVGTNSLSNIFTEITSVEASEDVIIVTGTAKEGQREQLVILERPNPDENTWTLKRVYNGNFTGIINNAMILGDYYYLVGDGWIAAASIDGIKAAADRADKTLPSSGSVSTTNDKNKLIWCETTTNKQAVGKIYALDGRLTEG